MYRPTPRAHPKWYRGITSVWCITLDKALIYAMTHFSEAKINLSVPVCSEIWMTQSLRQNQMLRTETFQPNHGVVIDRLTASSFLVCTVSVLRLVDRGYMLSLQINNYYINIQDNQRWQTLARYGAPFTSLRLLFITTHI